MWFGLANEQIFHQFAMFNILGTLYTKLYNQRIMADQQGLRLVTAIPRMEQCGHRIKTGGEPPCITRGTGLPPPELNKRSTGPTQVTQRSRNRMEQPYRRSAPEPRVVHGPHRPWGGACTPREHECTYTQRTRGTEPKGNGTEPAERTDHMEWRTGR